MNVLFVTNFCTHFLVKPFEEVAKIMQVRFVFFSDGGEGYWEKSNKLHSGAFEHRYLPGFYLGRKFRVTPGLMGEVLSTRADVIVKCIAGRVALPMTYLLARLRGKPFILWTGLWYHPGSFFHKLSWPLSVWIYRHADAIIVYGEHVKRYLVSHGCAPEKIFLFWQSIDPEKMGRAVDEAKVAAYRERWGSDAIVYVGRLEEVKSLDTLIAAFAELRRERPCSLVIVGKGPEKAALEAQARALGVPVFFEDYVPNPELPELYAAARVFCLPSRSLPMVKEAWGLVLNEAMLQRCIPVASDAVGAAVGGLFFPEIASLVFKERDVADLKRALARGLEFAGDPSIREKSREKALYFNPKRQAQGLFEAVTYVMGLRK